MIRALADTHGIVWYLGKDTRLSPAARDIFESARVAGDYIGISAITLVEMVFLIERNRIAAERLVVLRAALSRRRAAVRVIPLNRAVADTLEQVARVEVPEMGDRIIAATALHLGVPIITRDTDLTKSRVPTIW